MIFKCKNCGGNAVYSPERHGMFCPFCDSEGSAQRQDGSGGEITVCQNCGGEVPVLEHTAAVQCPYCDHFLILESRIEGEYEPKLMIPFGFGREKCKSSLCEKFKKHLFAPTDFLSEARLNNVQGTYVPFWFYDYDITCDFQGEGRKVRSWTAGKMRYTETSYYQIYRNMDIDFQKIPADASDAMPDDVMDLMEPYDYSELQDFKPEFLSGFFAEKYNMPSDAAESRARQKMNEDAARLVNGSYDGYAHVTVQRNNVQIRSAESRYGLLPVWKYIYKYREKEYPFYVNGQSGKIVGRVPVSGKKALAYTGTLWAVLTILLGAASGILYLL